MLPNEISDTALDAWYRDQFIGSYGYDPYEGPYEEEESEEE